MSYTTPKYGLVVPSPATRLNQLGTQLQQMGISIEEVLNSFDYNGADPNLVASRVAALEAWRASAQAKLDALETAADDTGWMDCPFVSGNTSPANRRLQVRRQGNRVFLRGALQKTSGNIPGTSYNHMANLPDSRFFPPSGAPAMFPPIGAAGANSTFGSINNAGTIQVYPSAAIGWADFAGVFWFVD